MAKYHEDNIEIMEERICMWRYAERPNYRQTELHESNTIRVITIPKPEIQKEQKKAKKKTKVIECCECGRGFQFTGGEQHFYEKHDLSQPKRCPECRKRRKEMFKFIYQNFTL